MYTRKQYRFVEMKTKRIDWRTSVNGGLRHCLIRLLKQLFEIKLFGKG